MFQFTTTNVINSNQDLTTGKPLWSVLAASGDTPASLYVKRVNKFIATNIVAIYKAEAHDAENAKVTLDFSQVNGTAGDVFRLHIYVGLSLASQSSLYANDLQWKGKPFSVDFVWESSAADTVAKLVKTINKYSIMVYNRRMLNVTSSGTYITIEATDEYQRFKFVNIEKFDSDAYHGMGDYDIVRSLNDLTEADSNDAVTASAEGYFQGKEGFGTYPFLLHNLRLPTYARNRWLALNLDETPIVGAKYNQYTIYYCVNRGILGDNAVGDLVKSRTTHVFYVKEDLTSDFESALALVGTIYTVEEGSTTPDPDTLASSDVEGMQDSITSLTSTVTALQSQVSNLESTGTSAIQQLLSDVSTLLTTVAGKQDALNTGDGLEVSGNTFSVKLDGDTLTVSSDGLKVTDGKFQEA